MFDSVVTAPASFTFEDLHTFINSIVQVRMLHGLSSGASAVMQICVCDHYRSMPLNRRLQQQQRVVFTVKAASLCNFMLHESMTTRSSRPCCYQQEEALFQADQHSAKLMPALRLALAQGLAAAYMP